MKTITSLGCAVALACCGIPSDTIIKPNDIFVLGNKPHGSFQSIHQTFSP